jgi:hypothetical protein
MTKQSVFLIRADNDRECVMKLPVNRYGGITSKGFAQVRSRFYDGTTATQHGLKYALNLEAFSSGHNIAKAIEQYYRNEV